MISNDDKATIHKALEEAKGSRKDAATALGIEVAQLHTLIHNNLDLKARWAKSRNSAAPSEAITIHRPLLPTHTAEMSLATEEEIAKAMEKEDASVKAGLTAIGVRGLALDMAISLQKFQQKHFQRAIEMLGGGITKQFLELMAEIERITARLNDTTTPLEPGLEMILRDDRSRLLDLMNKFYDRANQAVLTQAKIALIKKQAEGGGGKQRPGKPGFSPLVALKVEGNVTVNESSE